VRASRDATRGVWRVDEALEATYTKIMRRFHFSGNREFAWLKAPAPLRVVRSATP